MQYIGKPQVAFITEIGVVHAQAAEDGNQYKTGQPVPSFDIITKYHNAQIEAYHVHGEVVPVEMNEMAGNQSPVFALMYTGNMQAGPFHAVADLQQQADQCECCAGKHKAKVMLLDFLFRVIHSSSALTRQYFVVKPYFLAAAGLGKLTIKMTSCSMGAGIKMLIESRLNFFPVIFSYCCQRLAGDIAGSL
jgi:hypothetical protein